MIQKSITICVKIWANILGAITAKVVSDTQSGFIKGWYIVEGVVQLHETLHEIHSEKQSGLFCVKLCKRKALGINGVIGS